MTLFNLSAILTLDKSEFDKGIADADEKGSSLGGKLASGLGTGAKALGAGIAAAAAGIAALSKTALDNYANYEQLVGGVETLFGDQATTVLENASNAFQTAGLSMNDYMETVTGMSAALINSLGGDTEAAARVADQAITDMADNANKMGTSIESIQNAYSGFAKGNYTMLDNLKLGYGGTRQEMERLINDANKLRKEQGKNADLTVDSYADIVEAIHTVQEEMGITGATQAEASTTIQGSIAAMQASWQNFLTVLGTGSKADIKTATDNLVNSFKTAVGNIVPVLGTILTSMAGAIKDLAPVLATELPKIINDLLPPLLEAAGSLIAGIVSALPTLLTTLANALPGALAAVGNAIIDTFDSIFNTDLRGMWNNVKGWFSEKLSLVVQFAQGALKTFNKTKDEIAAWLSGLGDAIVDFIVNFPETWEQIKQKIADGWNMTIWPAIQNFFKTAFGVEMPDWGSVTSTITTAWENLKKAIKDFFKTNFNVELPSWSNIKAQISAGWNSMKTAIANWFKTTFSITLPSWSDVKKAIEDWWEDLKSKINLTITALFGFKGSPTPGVTGTPETPEEAPTTTDGWWSVDPITGATNYIPLKGRSIGGDTQDIADAVSSAIYAALSGMRIEMDGKAVADLVTDRVSRNIAGKYAMEGAW